jgi:hypothetical protein
MFDSSCVFFFFALLSPFFVVLFAVIVADGCLRHALRPFPVGDDVRRGNLISKQLQESVVT